ncbi:MAG TPA: 50S ribosomal protein L21, partial [Bacteroidia bacterium]|nr:50S ribosomal protein L21 [Bacteroidia bacterium]
MYAIVNIAGQQFKVSENSPLFVHRSDANEGEQVSFDQVLLVGNNGSVKVGAPTVSG